MPTRCLVVQPPPADRPEHSPAPLGVGVVRWFAPMPCLTILVKGAFSFQDGRALTPVDEHPLPSHDLASAIRGLEGELGYPTDFVPFKPQLDVMLVGHAFAEPQRQARIDARVEIGSVGRSFSTVAGTPTDRIPLGAGYLRDIDGLTPAEPVGPMRRSGLPGGEAIHAEDFDYSAYCSAATSQRSGPLEAGARLSLAGLSPKGRLMLELPKVAPRVLLEWAGSDATEIAMNLDTLLVDTDAERAILVWRGAVDSPADVRLDHVVVALDQVGGDRSWAAMRRNILRGDFSFAVEPDVPSPAPRPGTDEAERIEIARYEAHGAETGAEPSISLEDYASVSAELAEQREPRADTLRRHGLDETTWLVEERGWLETIARHATDGDGTLAARYGELFVAAQDGLAAPAEAERTVADYAAILVALENAEDLPKALEEKKLTLAAWMRLDRRMQRAAADDPAVEAELARRVAAVRATNG